MNTKAITLHFETGTSVVVLANNVADAFTWFHTNRPDDTISHVTYKYVVADLTKGAQQ